MIQSRSDMRFYIKEDMKRNNISNSFFRKFIMGRIINADNYRVARFLYTLRHLEYYKNCKQGLMGKLIYYILLVIHYRQEAKFNIHLSPNVAGYGLRIMHIAGGGGVFLSCSQIGNYCGVNSGVLCGKKNGLTPTLGNYVTLGPGCKVIGGVIIGDNSLIAHNAVVLNNVQPNSIMGGIPAKLLKTIEDGVYS